MSRKQNKPNSEALRRGLYIGAMVQDALDKQQYKIASFDEVGDPTWGAADGNYSRNCELVPGQKRRFQTYRGRTSWTVANVERFRDIEVPEAMYDEALAVLAAHFEGRK